MTLFYRALDPARHCSAAFVNTSFRLSSFVPLSRLVSAVSIYGCVNAVARDTTVAHRDKEEGSSSHLKIMKIANQLQLVGS